jgi:hypothetical protein
VEARQLQAPVGQICFFGCLSEATVRTVASVFFVITEADFFAKAD